jgi:hypothetical protein
MEWPSETTLSYRILSLSYKMVSLKAFSCPYLYSQYLLQPPKRRAAPAKHRAPVKRASKLAKENGLSADQEAEIREAYALFAVHHPEHEDSKEGVLRKDDVRRCLM